MKYKVTIIGHFSSSLDGQTIKTKIITDELIDKYGRDRINTFNTVGGIKTLIKVFFAIPSLLRNSKNVCMLPAHNAIRILTPLLSFWNRKYRRKLHYCVIGGWLPEFIKNRKLLASELRSFDYIYVETATMKSLLEEQGFDNIVVMPNCKKLNVLKPEELVYQEAEPHKICTFSRVDKNKGIEDAVNAVKSVNETNGRVVYTLDIYGQIDDDNKEWFSSLSESFPDYVCYKGLIPYDKSVSVLKEYFALLFPTKYYTEGIPGTIIDAYAAGLPVIASKWLNYNDIIEEGNTGIGYEFDDLNSLVTLLSKFANNPNAVLSMRECCLNKYKSFSPEEVVKLFEFGGVCKF